MKKQVHPAVIVIAVVVLVAIVGFVFYRSSASPEAQPMSPNGPGAAVMKKNGGDMTKFMTPEEKAMMQQSMGGKKAQ